MVDSSNNANGKIRRYDAERLRAMDLLLGGVAHDINNPLNAILMNVELATLLVQQGAPTDDVANTLTIIANEARRGGALTRRLLALASAKDYSATELTSLNDAVTLAHKLMQGALRDAGVTVSLTLAESLAPLSLNPLALAQALAVLIGDAVAGGARSVAIATSLDPLGNALLIKLASDPGPALGAQQRAGGAGLAERIVSDHDGELQIGTENSPEEILIRLPLAAA